MDQITNEETENLIGKSNIKAIDNKNDKILCIRLKNKQHLDILKVNLMKFLFKSYVRWYSRELFEFKIYYLNFILYYIS